MGNYVRNIDDNAFLVDKHLYCPYGIIKGKMGSLSFSYTLFCCGSILLVKKFQVNLASYKLEPIFVGVIKYNCLTHHFT